MIEDVDKAKKIIEANVYMTIATMDGNVPWISPVFFAYDLDYSLYWVSNKDARHSKNIRHHPNVAIVVFNSQAIEGDGDGVYFEAEVIELIDFKEIEQAMVIFNARATQDDFKVKKVSEVANEGIWRIYKAVPNSISKLTKGDFINGQYIDRRVEIKL